MKIIKVYFTSSVIARIITSILLFLALTSQQIGYYKFLRWVVFVTAIYTAFISYNKNEQMNLGVWLFGVVSILFNPFFLFYLGKSGWQIADVIVAFIFIISTFVVKENKSS